MEGLLNWGLSFWYTHSMKYAYILLAALISTPLYASHTIAHAALGATNRFRIKQGLPALAWHEGLAHAAKQHSKNMAHGAPFSHAGFEQRVEPYACKRASENIYYTPRQSNVAEDAVASWITSPGHRKNLEGKFTHCGIGVYPNSRGHWYVTQILASF